MTRITRLDEKGNCKPDKIDIRELPPNGFTRADIMVVGGIGAHSTKMYRVERRIEDYPNLFILDLFIHIEQIGEGRAYIVGNQPYAVYRENVGMLRMQSETVVSAICDTLAFSIRNIPIAINTSILGHCFVFSPTSNTGGIPGKTLYFCG